MKKIFLLLAGIISLNTHAYPEMVRHHYPNCIACHESPSGGGLLTPYGRTISHSVLSTWGSEKEAQSFYGLFNNKLTQNWLNVGGDFRALQLHTNSKQMMMGRTIRMQTGVEAAIKVFNAKLVSFFGKQEEGNMVRGESVRHYLLVQPLDELTVRIGRFMPNFGLNVPEHHLPTRKSIGFDQGTERDQIELMWSGEKVNLSSSYSQSQKTKIKKSQEKSLSAQINYNFLDSYRLGLSLWHGRENQKSRSLIGVNGVLGFTEHFYYLTEFDWQRGFDEKNGLFHFSKLGFEIVKGFHLLAIEEYRKSDIKSERTLVNSFGLGASWYPRPHFDFEFIWNKKRTASQSSDYTDYAFLMSHYYF